MSWLFEQEPNHRELAASFLRRITNGEILKIPGAHDGMAARIAKQFDFEALYLSGAAYTASRGLPDLGLIYSNEVAERARELIRASGLPLLVDIDTGFGGVLNVARTAKEMVEVGVAAVQMEDQNLPKKCGHLNGKSLVSSEEMMQKIKTIKEVSPSLVVIARTDAKGVEGMEAAIERAKLYLAAGADGIFPEALESEEDFRTFRAAVDGPLLANMTEFGKTPYFTAEQFEAWGYNMVIYPVTSLRVAAKAYEGVFSEISKTGTQVQSLPNMQTRKELYEAIRYYDYEALDGKIAKTVLPENE
ncbi:methylisocitrate lyase [Paenibacillus frigoriresistens]|uniref:methylisocitrate lyase n=1 Tax=Paenibacillus alginolyticus TaxID=59839 RepID=UPI0015630BCF|nr:methylisocitrate lyase [Paenibacillus frigoriresistens]NRF94357.1 methylisocitrate lyase [Paenibacillus frigoriresistens]